MPPRTPPRRVARAALLLLFASAPPHGLGPLGAAAASLPCECDPSNATCGGDECRCDPALHTTVPRTCEVQPDTHVAMGVDCPRLQTDWTDRFFVDAAGTGAAHPPRWEWSACNGPLGVRDCPYLERPACDPSGYSALGRGVILAGVNLAAMTDDTITAAVSDPRVNLPAAARRAASVLAGKVGVQATAALCGCARDLRLTPAQAAGFFQHHYEATTAAVRRRYDSDAGAGAFDRLRRCYKTVLVDVFLDTPLPGTPPAAGNVSAFWAAAVAEQWGLASNLLLPAMTCLMCTPSRVSMNIEMIRECTRTCSPDVVFVIDGSGSVTKKLFHDTELPAVVNMGRAIGEDNFDAGADGTNAALVLYSDCSATGLVKEAELTNAKNFSDFKKIVDSIEYPRGGTCTGKAMRLAIEKMTETMRTNKPHFIFLLTDGEVTQVENSTTRIKSNVQDLDDTQEKLYADERFRAAKDAYDDHHIVSFGIGIESQSYDAKSLHNDVALDVPTEYGQRVASATWGNISAVGKQVVQQACQLPALLDPDTFTLGRGETKYFRLDIPVCVEPIATLIVTPSGMVEISVAFDVKHPNPANADFTIVTNQPFKRDFIAFWPNGTRRGVNVAIVGLSDAMSSISVDAEKCCGLRECFTRTATATATPTLTQSLPGWIEWRSPSCLPIATGAVGGIRLVLQVPAVPGSDRRVTLSPAADCAGLPGGRLSSIEPLGESATTAVVNFQPLYNWAVAPEAATVCAKDEAGSEGWQPVPVERPRFRLFHGAPRWTSVSPARPEAGTPFVVELAGRSLRHSGLQAVVVEDTGKASCTGSDPLARAVAVADVVADAVDTGYARHLAFNGTKTPWTQVRICVRHVGGPAADLWSSLPRGPRDEANSFRQCGFAIAPAVRPPDGSGCGLVARLSRQPAVGAEVEVRLCVPRPGANVTAPTFPADCARLPPADCVVRVLDGTGEEMCPSPTLRPAAGSDTVARFSFSAQRAGAMGAFRVLCGAAEQRLFVHPTPYEAEARRVLAEVGAIDPVGGPAGAPGQCGAPDDGVFRGSRDCGLRVPVDFSGSRFIVDPQALTETVTKALCEVLDGGTPAVGGGCSIEPRYDQATVVPRSGVAGGRRALSVDLLPGFELRPAPAPYSWEFAVAERFDMHHPPLCSVEVDVLVTLPEYPAAAFEELVAAGATGTESVVYSLLMIDVGFELRGGIGAVPARRAELLVGAGTPNQTSRDAVRFSLHHGNAAGRMAVDSPRVFPNAWSTVTFPVTVPDVTVAANLSVGMQLGAAAVAGWKVHYGGHRVVCTMPYEEGTPPAAISNVSVGEFRALEGLRALLGVPDGWETDEDPCFVGWPGVECRAGRIVAITVSQQSDDVLEKGPSRTRRTGDPVPLRFAGFSRLETLVLRGVEGRRPLVLDADSLRDNFALRTLEVTGGDITVMPLVSAGTWRDDLRTPGASAEPSWRPLQCLRQLSLRSVTAPEVPVPLGAVPDAVAFPDPQGDVMRLPRLRHLWLVDTGAKGGLPADLPALLPSLLTLDVSGNELSGDLPPLPPALFSALFRSNRFSGWVPGAWATLHAVKSLDVGRNQVSNIPWEALAAKGNGGDAVFLVDGNPIAAQAIRPLPYGSYTLGNITWHCPLPRRDPSGWTGMKLLDYDALNCA